MRIINIHDAKTHLSRLVEDAAKGEEIVIAKAGRHIARLMPLPSAQRRIPRFGTLQGKIRMTGDWDGLEDNQAIWAQFWENIERQT